MKVMPLGKKLFISYLLVGILPAALVAGVCYYIANRTQARIIRQSLDSFHNAVDQAVAQNQSTIAMTGQMLAQVGEVVDGMRRRDEAFLARYAADMVAAATEFNMLGFADAAGRVYSWGQQDDTPMDVSKRNLFREAMQGRPAIALSSSDLSRAAVLGYFPIFDDDRRTILGLVMVGRDLTKPDFVDMIKQFYGVECTIFSGDERVATTIEDGRGGRAIGTRMTNPTVIETVLRGGRNFQDHNVILGNGYDTIYWPMRNTVGDIIGMYFVGQSDAIVAEASRAILTTVLFCIAGVMLVTAAVATLTARSVVGPIVTSIETLSLTATLLTDSAADIAGTSAELVDSANAQASSMEESASSLNELTSQSKGNADTADSAKSLMEETQHAVTTADASMREMLETMNRIKASSDEVSGIAKTIEEISFQTNLLALNASVEAARAGDHGKGFAVVADEVRNLAQRAGDAAKTTSELIGQSVELSNQGAGKVEEVAKSIEATLDTTSRVGEMLVTVGVNSREQSHAIEQINVAVANMDRATQNIAESSTQVADTSKVLEEKSGDMDVVIGQLTAIVGAKKLEKIQRKRERKLGKQGGQGRQLQLPYSG